MVVLCLWASGTTAQSTPETADVIANVRTLRLLAKHYEDSIVLRWAPVSAETWHDNLNKPCLVARREVSPNPGEYEVISDSIRLMPEANLESYAVAHAEHPLLVVLLNNAYRDWENSLYDGNPATMAEKAANFNNRWSLTLFAADRDPVVATAAGMRFVDRNIRPGVTYAYKVFVPGTYLALDHDVVPARQRDFRPMIYQGFARDSSLMIQWQRRLHDPHYTAYFIERSADGRTFERLNELPYVQAFQENETDQSAFYTYTDRISDGRTYTYRLVGLDAFGDESEPSIPVALKTRDMTPPSSPLPEITVDSMNRNVRIRWAPSPSADCAGYVILYGQGGDDVSPVSAQLADTARTFAHRPADFNGMGTYKIAAIDTAGNLGLSEERLIRIPDFVPPSAPDSLVAVTDTTGLIRVRWAKPAEADVIGYFVYAADGEDRHFHRLTPKLYPFRQFTDTVDLYSLTEKRRYKIVAVDDAMNYSAYSAVLDVERPDIIPPAPAFIRRYEVSDSAVILHIAPSASRDVVRHDVRRKDRGDTTWVVIQSRPVLPVQNIVRDTAITPGGRYVYDVIAIDERGLSSRSVQERYIDMPWKRTPEGFSFTAVKVDEASLDIRWQGQTTAEDVELYVRSGETWTLLHRCTVSTGQYTLRDPSESPLMGRLRFADGSHSPFMPITP